MSIDGRAWNQLKVYTEVLHAIRKALYADKIDRFEYMELMNMLSEAFESKSLL